ncbi:MAG: ion transporter, partial [Oscillospiraceae bacterium]|nr:ion transporter [Oscillospiraceae bacterium]
ARLRFLRSFDGVVDLMTILPFFFLDGFIVFRMLRVVRILHLFRINAQYDSFQVITTVLFEKRNQILSSVFIIIVLMLSSSLCMYGAEHDAQPENFRNAFSGIWWSMSTLLTVGYGDIYPVTTVGKAMAICIAFLGVGVVAIPTGIISAGFVEQYTQKEHADTCLQDVREVGEILLDAEHDFCGQTVADVQTHYQLQILLVLRSGLTVLPRGEMTLEPQDLIILHSDKIVK